MDFNFSFFQILIAILCGVILFLYGVEHFSKEIQLISGHKFRRFLAQKTKNPFMGFLLGAFFTVLVQSSSATSVITVSLVNAGVLEFRNSIGIIIGANLGTTITAQLVALKLTQYAPILILCGFFLGLLPIKYKILGKAVFYFGFIFFTFHLISIASEPLKNNPQVLSIISMIEGPLFGILLGALFTALVQASAVATGIAVILLQNEVFTLDIAIPFVLGSNIGTTSTSLIAAINLDYAAKRTALAHFFYNTLGIIFIFPFLTPFKNFILSFEQSPAQSLATAHILFNLGNALPFLIFNKYFAKIITKIIPDPIHEDIKAYPKFNSEESQEEQKNHLTQWVLYTKKLITEAYKAHILSIETMDKKLVNRAQKISHMIQFSLQELQEHFFYFNQKFKNTLDSNSLIHFMITFDTLRQIADSLNDLNSVYEDMLKHNTRFNMDALFILQELTPTTLKILEQTIDVQSQKNLQDLSLTLEKTSTALEETIKNAYAKIAQENKSSSTHFLMNILSIHQRIRSKSLSYFVTTPHLK